MEVQTAVETDIEKLLELRLENAEYHAKTVAKSTLKIDAPDFFRKHTLDCLKNEDCRILVGIVDKEIIGYIIGFINQQHPIFDLGKEALIDDFYVNTSFQKKGYGKILYDALIEWFIQNNIKRINLNVYQNNPKGQHFWNKQNFEVQFNRMSKNIN